MVIYKTTNLINGKIYIGKKSNMKRFNNYYGSGIVVQHAINKYGIENFSKEIIQECFSYNELNEAEKYWISYYNSTNPNIGYNRSYGGDGFSGITPETIEKIRQKNLGSKRNQEQRKRMGDARKGCTFTDEHKKHLSEKRKLRVTKSETLKKMSKSMMGKNSCAYLVVDQNDNEYVTENGLSQFCKEHNLTSSNMHKTLNGERKHHKGWRILKKFENKEE